MSEQVQPTPDEVEAQAAQSAKNLLEEAQAEDYKDAVNSRNRDEGNGKFFKRKDTTLKDLSDTHFEEANKLDKKASALRIAETHMTDQGESDIAEKLGKDAQDLERDETENRDKADYYQSRRTANLWDAHQHLRANETSYKAEAVKDANAAGHDVSYNGVEYPANPPQTEAEKPPQSPA